MVARVYCGINAVRPPVPIDVVIGGETYRIRRMPAARWVEPVYSRDWLGLVPLCVEGLVSSGRCVYDQQIADVLAENGRDAMESAAKEALGEATGMPWWSARILISTCLSDAVVAGSLVVAGVDATRVSIGAYVAAVYRVLADGRDKRGMRTLERKVYDAPAGVSAGERYDPEDAAAQFNMAHAAYSAGQ